ncbi:MAG: hypothetical protein WHV66_09560, partial [Anaerolineales bacterium]
MNCKNKPIDLIEKYKNKAGLGKPGSVTRRGIALTGISGVERQERPRHALEMDVFGFPLGVEPLAVRIG